MSVTRKRCRSTINLRRNAADVAWHERLIANCPNSTLRQEISVLRARSRSIDGALLRGLANTEGSYSEHEEISAAIAEGNLAKAAKLVIDHWHGGIGVVTTWIKETIKGAAA